MPENTDTMVSVFHLRNDVKMSPVTSAKKYHYKRIYFPGYFFVKEKNDILHMNSKFHEMSYS